MIQDLVSGQWTAIPIRDGQAAGEPIAIASNFEPPETYPNGMIISKTGGQSGGQQVFLGTLDSEGHLGSWKSVDRNDGNGDSVDLSPDGRQMVYTAGQNSRAVRVRDLATEEDKEVYWTNGGQILNCLWARRLPKIFCARIPAGWAETEILSIDLHSGRTEKVGSLDGARALIRVSPDDRTLVTVYADGSDRAFEWEFNTVPATEKPAPLYESSDGRWVLTSVSVDGPRRIMIRESSGDNDEMRLLVQTRIQPGSAPPGPPVQITPDSKWVVYQDKDAAGTEALYRASVFGGAPERLGHYPTSGSGRLSISADGRQFLATGTAPLKPIEFWILENLIPPAKAPAK